MTDIPGDRVEKALKNVYATDMVSGLPSGLQTNLWERGGNLSSGEKQLLAFARALAADPELVILDEATSNIDMDTEEKIRLSLDVLLAGRTALIVAHRPFVHTPRGSDSLFQRGQDRSPRHARRALRNPARIQAPRGTAVPRQGGRNEKAQKHTLSPGYGIFWKEKKGLIALLLFLTLLSSLVAVAFPLLTKELFDMLEGILSGKGEYPDPLAALRKAALFFIGLGVAGFISGFFPGIRGALNVVFDYIIRKKYFAELTEKDYRFFAEFSSGDLVTRLTSDINDFPKLSWFLCSGIFQGGRIGEQGGVLRHRDGRSRLASSRSFPSRPCLSCSISSRARRTGYTTR